MGCWVKGLSFLISDCSLIAVLGICCGGMVNQSGNERLFVMWRHQDPRQQHYCSNMVSSSLLHGDCFEIQRRLRYCSFESKSTNIASNLSYSSEPLTADTRIEGWLGQSCEGSFRFTHSERLAPCKSVKASLAYNTLYSTESLEGVCIQYSSALAYLPT